MAIFNWLCYVFCILVSLSTINCRRYRYSFEYEGRSEFALSKFGFLSPGFLYVNISNLQISNMDVPEPIGFTLDRAFSAGISPYIENREQDKCILTDYSEELLNSKTDIVSMILNFSSLSVNISRMGAGIQGLSFYKNLKDMYSLHSNEFREKSLIGVPLLNPVQMLENITDDDNSSELSPHIDYNPASLQKIPMTMTKLYDQNTYSFEFVMYVSNESFNGLYNLFFHNCKNLNSITSVVRFDIGIIEKNAGNYLTAFEIYLPTIYLAFATIYFCCGVLWMMVLRKGESENVLKIHYLMLLMVAVKCLSVFVHSIDYHFINVSGHSHNTWAVLYYVTNVIRGLLLFTVLVLIGSGWQLVKHVFSTNEKRVFVLVISLQVVTNLAFVLKENTEEGAERHELWQQIFILVDLICCGIVLFPIVWSIRHLQEAVNVDGKGSANLVKLKLFRRFYITIVCYIYFTRIVVYLLRILVNFQYRWLDAVCTEGSTLAFFIFTAYTFRPNSDNPYIRLSQTDDDDSDCEDSDVRRMSHSGQTSAEHGNFELVENEADVNAEIPFSKFKFSANIRRKLRSPSSPQNGMQKSVV